jgi:hypothetical protein
MTSENLYRAGVESEGGSTQQTREFPAGFLENRLKPVLETIPILFCVRTANSIEQTGQFAALRTPPRIYHPASPGQMVAKIANIETGYQYTDLVGTLWQR